MSSRAKCFVLERPDSSDGGEVYERDGWDCYRNIAALKRLGFSLDEIKQLTMTDFIAFTDVTFGEDSRKKAARMATQEDIDQFMS